METRSKTRALKAVETSTSAALKEAKGRSTVPLASTEHPLLNHVVLTTIFKNVNKKDLAMCRLVSSTWYDASLPQWRSNVVLSVKPTGGHLDSQYRRFFGAGRSRDKTFPSVTALQKAERVPYRKIRIENGLSLEYEGKFFWNTFGSLIKELHLDSSSSIHHTSWKAILFEKTPNLRKLVLGRSWPDMFLRSKKVEMEEGKYADLPVAKRRNENLKSLDLHVSSPFEYFPVTPEAFLTFFSKVEEIVVRAHQKTEVFRFLKAIRHVIREDANNLRIQHLDMLSCDSPLFETPAMNLLVELGLPLKVLKLDLTGFKGSLHQLGDSIADSLQEFVVSRNFIRVAVIWISPLPLIPFTKPMDSLQVIKFMGSIVSDMRFLQNTKNLNKLYLFEGLLPREYWNTKIPKSYRPVIGSDFSNLLENLDDEHPLRNLQLEKLLEFQTDYYIKSSDVPLLGKWFPNLEVLRAALDSGTCFAQMCTQWGKLRELILDSRSTLKDADIVGTTRDHKSPSRRNPNITLLKDLEVFRLEKVGGCGLRQSAMITDHSVRKGFALLPKLKIFEIPNIVKLSQKSLQLLKNKGVTVILSENEVVCQCLEPQVDLY